MTWLAIVFAAAVGITITVIALTAPTWSTVSIGDPNAGVISSISCAPGGLCMAYGQDNQVYTNGGTDGPWNVTVPLPGLSNTADEVGGVACFTGGCVAATNTALYLTDQSASHWRLLWSAPSWWHVVSPTCTPSGSLCMAFANTYRFGRESPPGGHEAIVSITNPQVLSGSGPTIAVHEVAPYPVRWIGILGGSCPTSTVCEGVSPNGVWRTTDRGATWHLQLSLHSTFSAGGWETLTCPSPSTCLAGAGAANFAVTHDGGRTWQLVNTAWSNVSDSSGDDETGSVAGIFCDTSSHCLAAVSEGSSAPTGVDFPTGYVLETTDGGVTWSQQSVSVGASLDSISCTQSLGCWSGGWSNSSDPSSNASALLFHALEK